MSTHNTNTFDAIPPHELALKAEQVGVDKASRDSLSVFALAVLAGAFISLGAVFSTTTAMGAETLAPGVVRTLSGLTFSLGLILVVLAGAELFTGNNLIVMAWASRRISLAAMLKNWSIVYVGNFVGAVVTALLVFLSAQHEISSGQFGAKALAIAEHKTALSFGNALVLGILCNALVCLAVWLTMSARSVSDKILAIIFPITAFVAAGFEHSVANMYFVPLGLMIKDAADGSFWTLIAGTPASYPHLTLGNFFVNNLLPVTIGNIIGGAGLVAGVYWFIYLRKRSSTEEA